jgi:radical SAM protein with 4Fe4S-binding SPASM domain
VHCYLPQTSGRAKTVPLRELSTEEWEKVMLQLKGMGCLFLVLTGGEPLLRPDLAALCRRATKLGFAIKIFTSGAGLTRGLMAGLRGTNVSRFELSFYGPPHIHDPITGIKGSGLRALAAARALKKAGFRVKLKTPVMKATVGELGYIAALARKNGFEYAFDPTLTLANDGERSNLSRRAGDRELEALLTDPVLNPVENNASSTPAADSPVCGAGHNTVCVGPYGDIYPCLQLQIKLGNLRKKSLRRIWDSTPWLKKWRNTAVSDIKECASCADIEFCSRCPGVSLLEEGDIGKPYKTACATAKIMHRIRP